ncbi:MAG: CPBP family intramembrane metalloprotease [Opitutales bacterium]|nr:CPBP family intramembrane metalloprotease [Opitutales bacterium]
MKIDFLSDMISLRKQLTAILTVFLCFGLYYAFNEFYFAAIRKSFVPIVTTTFASIPAYLIVGIPIFIGFYGLKRFAKTGETGLWKDPFPAVLFALIATLPMFVGYSFSFEFSDDLKIWRIVHGVLCAAFFEELYFRSFLFGMLYRNTKLGFIPGIVLGSLVFASGHLYQSQDPATLIRVFMVTFMGGLLFAWVFAEWKWNLWVPVFLHLFMNLSWMLFDVANNAWGNNMANLFRVLTIAFIILGTIIIKKRKKMAFEIRPKTLIWRKS